MPELPEVETTLRGITPHISTQKITNVIVRDYRLRWPIPATIGTLLKSQTILQTYRRGKYILLKCKRGTLILHLGMSGSLRILTHDTPPNKHDHLDIVFKNKVVLRLTDPRRFGACLWTEDNPEEHLLLKNLGPEPLSPQFTANYLWERAQKRKTPIKSFIMDSNIVVGVGNIYAAEALFAAEINPNRLAGEVSKEQFNLLVQSIKKILKAAILKGGTTLKDFVDSKGKPGYFSQKLQVYGREGQTCNKCKTPLTSTRLGQRATVFCAKCQK